MFDIIFVTKFESEFLIFPRGIFDVFRRLLDSFLEESRIILLVDNEYGVGASAVAEVGREANEDGRKRSHEVVEERRGTAHLLHQLVVRHATGRKGNFWFRKETNQ